MAAAVDDSVLAEFAVTGTPTEVAGQLRERFGDVVDRLSLNTPYEIEPSVLVEVLASLRDQDRSMTARHMRRRSQPTARHEP
jgi:hypothetical protein